MIRLPWYILLCVGLVMGFVIGLWTAKGKIDRLEVGLAGLSVMIQTQNGGRAAK